MTDKKADKPAGGTILEAMVKDKKTSHPAAVIEKGAPPAPAENKAKNAVGKGTTTETVAVTEAVPVAKHTDIIGAVRRHSRLEKAVEGAEKLGAKATPVEKAKGPTVVIAGMSISPIATGLKPTGSSGDTYVHEGKEFYLPHHLLYNAHTRNGFEENEPWVARTNYKSPEMSLFAFVYDNETFWLLMDEHSTFTRDAETYYCRTRSGQLIMINSTSHNDQFIGQAVLANVESSNNILNQSHIIVNSNRVGPERGWGGSAPFKVGDRRQKYSNLRLKKVDVVDSELTRGQYFSSNFTKSSVVGTGTFEARIQNSYLTECRIHGSRVKLKSLTGENLDFSAEGEVLIKGVGRLNNQQWHFPSIHVTNRFAFTEIDQVTRHDRGIKMVRINETEVEVALQQWKPGVKVAIDAPRYTVETLIRDGLNEGKDKKPETTAFIGPFGSPAYNGPFQPLGVRGSDRPGDGIRNFMEAYIVDQVVSRLGMIQMLDEVAKTAKDLEYGRRDDDVSFFD